MPEPQEGQQQVQATGQTLNPELAGFPTPEALAQAYRQLGGRYESSGAEAKRLHDENQLLKTQLQTMYQAPANPRPDVKQRGNPSDRLAEFGVPVDALSEYVQEQLQTAFAPIAAGLTARTTLLGQYPDYNKFEADVAQFIQADPSVNQTYQRMFAADPGGAFEYAYLKFGESRRRSMTSTGDLSAEAAAHAGIPSSRSGETRRQPEGNAAEVQRAREAWQQNDNATTRSNYAHARLHSVITDEFLNA